MASRRKIEEKPMIFYSSKVKVNIICIHDQYIKPSYLFILERCQIVCAMWIIIVVIQPFSFRYSLLILLSSEIRWRMTWILTLNSKVGMIFVIAFDCEYTD